MAMSDRKALTAIKALEEYYRERGRKTPPFGLNEFCDRIAHLLRKDIEHLTEKMGINPDRDRAPRS